MASAVHKATIVSCQISGWTGSLSVYQRAVIMMYPPDNKRSTLWRSAIQTGSLFQTRVPEGLVFQGWGACWRLIGFPPCNLCPLLKCFVWDAGGGAEGWGGGEYTHTYSWRGGLRASCYVWVIKSSTHPPPNTHIHTHTHFLLQHPTNPTSLG